jgi:chaperonin GroES
MKIRPLYDRIVVKRIEEKEQKVGGLYIPDSAKEKPQEGEVIAVGKGKWEEGKLRPLEVQVGDHVLFGKYSGTEAPKTVGDDYLILREDEVLGILEDAPKVAQKAS